jgi:multiple sugar transport system ATP-binding protein
MNFVAGRIVTNGSAAVEIDGGIRLPLAGAPPASEGRRVVYGIRPEHIGLADGSDGVEVEVVVIEPTGSEIQIFTRLAGQEVMAQFRERHRFAPGQKIRLAPDLGLVHLFDAETGQRL